MDKIKTKDQFILDECIHFLDELQYEMDKRNKPHFEYMVSDAKELARFFVQLTKELKKHKKVTDEQTRAMAEE